MPRSTWFSDDPRKTYSALKGDLAVDVAIVGGGITGATTAYLLKQAGLKVALCDRRQCGDAETGHDAAPHLRHRQAAACAVDQFGGDVARATWDAGAVAVEQIAEIVEQEQIECNFVRVPGFLHAAWDDKEGRDRAGLDATPVMPSIINIRRRRSTTCRWPIGSAFASPIRRCFTL